MIQTVAELIETLSNFPQDAVPVDNNGYVFQDVLLDRPAPECEFGEIVTLTISNSPTRR